MTLLTSFYADTYESARQTKHRHESATAISREALERHLGRPCTGFYSYEYGFFSVSGGIDYVFNAAGG